MIREWISKNLPVASTIVEAGVCHGADTAWFLENLNKCTVYGFEPVIKCYNIAIQKTKKYGDRVELYNVALGKEEDEMIMYESSTLGSSSILKPTGHKAYHPTITFKESKTRVLNLDSFLKNKKISEIDFMWLDAQGCEKMILENSLESLSKTKYLYSEVSIIEMYSDSPRYNEYRSWLSDKGFEVVFEDIKNEDQGNVLFKNQNK